MPQIKDRYQLKVDLTKRPKLVAAMKARAKADTRKIGEVAILALCKYLNVRPDDE
jgi:hypothetical protein